MVSSLSGFPTSASSAAVAWIVDGPTPVSATPALATVPSFAPSNSKATAAPTVAKSPMRRSSLR